MNDDIARFALYRDTCSRVLVQRLAVFLERTVHRRHLANRAGELLLHGRKTLRGQLCQVHITALHHIAFGVAGGGGHAQQGNGFIGFGRVQLQATEFGGGTKAQRQHACCQRVERAGVARFFGAQQPLDLLQGIVAGKTQGFV